MSFVICHSSSQAPRSQVLLEDQGCDLYRSFPATWHQYWTKISQLLSLRSLQSLVQSLIQSLVQTVQRTWATRSFESRSQALAPKSKAKNVWPWLQAMAEPESLWISLESVGNRTFLSLDSSIFFIFFESLWCFLTCGPFWACLVRACPRIAVLWR